MLENSAFKIFLGMIAGFACSVVATLLSALVTGLFVSKYGLSLQGGPYDQYANGDFNVSFAVSFAVITTWFASFITLPSILVLAAPLHYIALKTGRVHGIEYAAAGALVGAFFVAAVHAASWLEISGFDFPGQMVVPSTIITPIIGASTAVGFWLVTRPDKMPKWRN